MKVILTETVKSLGSVGEIVNVSPGHARNFLIPGKKAVLADEGNSKALDHHKKVLAKKMGEEKKAAEAIASKVNGLTLELVKKVGGTGRLFGTVTTMELSKELENQGISIEKRLLTLDTPIKALGTFTVTAKVFSDVEAEFKVNVIMDPNQAKEIKAKQKAAEEAAIAKKEAAKLKAESGEEEEIEEKVELTDEEKLTLEANAILKDH